MVTSVKTASPQANTGKTQCCFELKSLAQKYTLFMELCGTLKDEVLRKLVYCV